MTERYRVIVDAHRVADRYDIPAADEVVGSDSPQGARLRLLRWLHSDARVPPWKPYLRESWPHSRADLYVMTKQEQMREQMRARSGGGSK